jgi:dynein heavy chain 1, cytosolic
MRVFRRSWGLSPGLDKSIILLTYMKCVEDVLGRGWELYAEGQKLQFESTAFRKKLDTWPVFDTWLYNINRRDMSVDGDRPAPWLAVDFDPQTITLFREVWNLHDYEDVKSGYPYTVSLTETMRTYR